MIEVELETTPHQTEDYRMQFNAVKTMCGKKKSRLVQRVLS